jgi:hypothetical protein
MDVTKRLWLVAVLVACAVLLLPSIALAKDKLTIRGVGGVYVVAKGSSFKLTGSLKGNAHTKHWDQHVPLGLEKRVNGRWIDIAVVRPAKGGGFAFPMRRPSSGVYRVRYHGCNHYQAASRQFRIKGGTAGPTVPMKLDPKISVDRVMLFGPPMTTRSVDGLPFQAHISTGQSAEAMAGDHLRVSALASISGATYTPVGSNLAPAYIASTNFGGSTEITVGPIFAARQDADGTPYNYYKIQADWDGNEYTNAGSATSEVWNAER